MALTKTEPASGLPTILQTKALYDRLSLASAPNPELDAHIYCWLNGWTLLPKIRANAENGFVFRDVDGKLHQQTDCPMFTYSITEAMNLVATMCPGVGLLMLLHPNGHWSVAWSNDGPPKLDNIHFDPAFLPLAIIAAVLEALGDREARKQ